MLNSSTLTSRISPQNGDRDEPTSPATVTSDAWLPRQLATRFARRADKRRMHDGDARASFASFQRLHRPARDFHRQAGFEVCEISRAAIVDLAGGLFDPRLRRNGGFLCRDVQHNRAYASWHSAPAGRTTSCLCVFYSADLAFLGRRLGRE